MIEISIGNLVVGSIGLIFATVLSTTYFIVSYYEYNLVKRRLKI